MATKLDTLKDLYLDELRDLYHAENQLARMLPEMEKGASADQLKAAFKTDRERTKQHVNRLERIFQELHEDPSGHACQGMEGLLQEGCDRMKRSDDAAIADAGLLVMAQKAQHYEMAGYGSACAFARMLHREEDARMLHQTLEEEKKADADFTHLAQESINLVAASAV